MRIAYVALHVEPKNMLGGVGQKIHAQMRCWELSQHSARLFALVGGGYRSEATYAYETESRVRLARPVIRVFSRARALSALVRSVREYQPDLIYLRAGGSIFPLHRIFSIAPVVLELNTNDDAELRARGWLEYWPNTIAREDLLKNVSGMIAVTSEIAQLPINQRFRKPMRVIGNGIDMEHYHALPAPRNATPVITMIGSPGMRWHGVDKLIQLAEFCTDLQIHVVGYAPTDFVRPLPANMIASGFADRDGVRRALAQSDVACGSLALHRNRMHEGSTLKVREALAYGIPTLLGYHDADLDNIQTDCILEIPNTEDNVASHAADIRSFAYRMRGRRLNPAELASRIDQCQKEIQRLAFFEEILQGRKLVKQAVG